MYMRENVLLDLYMRENVLLDDRLCCVYLKTDVVNNLDLYFVKIARKLKLCDAHCCLNIAGTRMTYAVFRNLSSL